VQCASLRVQCAPLRVCFETVQNLIDTLIAAPTLFVTAAAAEFVRGLLLNVGR
jgi:hypothetical protein